MTEIQAQLLTLLEELDGICREHDIPYYLDGGSLLGAVRHRGFLPWDDDVDIVLRREDFKRLRRILTEQPLPGRVLEDVHSNEKYTMVYARYCDITGTGILRTSMLDQFKSGVFIDIFVLDPIPDTQQFKREYFEILGGYAEYLNPYYYDTIVGDNEWYDKLRKLGVQDGKQAVHDFVEKRLFQYPDEEGMTYAFRFDLQHFIYSRETIGTPRRVLYEGRMLPIVSEPEDYLRIHYGDHWDIIPEDKNVETHNVAINVDVPYEQFRDSYLFLIDKDTEVQNYHKLHDTRIQRHHMTEAIDIKSYTTTAQLYSNMLSARKNRAERSLLEMLKERDYPGIRAFLGNYYTIQLHRWYMRYQVFVPIEDDLLYCALYVLLTEGEYSIADKVLNLRKATGEPLNPLLEKLNGIIGDIRQTVRLLEKGEVEAALALAERGMENEPDIPEYIEGAIRARAMLLREESDAKALLEMIRSQPEIILRRDRVCGVENMLTFRYGGEKERQQSEEILKSLMANSPNGMLRLEIQDFFDSLQK